MSRALRVLQGEFGRVALLDMNRPLVRHAHHHCHILFKSSGADASFYVNNEQSPLTDGTAVLINAWEPHCYNHVRDAPPTEILALYLEPSWLASIDKVFSASSERNFFARSSVVLDPGTRQKVAEVCSEIAYGTLNNTFDVQARIFDLTISVAHQFSNWRNLSPAPTRSRLIFDHRVKRSMSFMRDHTRYNMSTDHLAGVAGLSRPRFYELFKECTGLTPNLFASMLVVEGAIERLANSNCAISDVAFDLGFSAQSNFARFFAQHVGCSPSDYRRKVDLFRASEMAGEEPLAH